MKKRLLEVFLRDAYEQHVLASRQEPPALRTKRPSVIFNSPKKSRILDPQRPAGAEISVPAGIGEVIKKIDAALEDRAT